MVSAAILGKDFFERGVLTVGDAAVFSAATAGFGTDGASKGRSGVDEVTGFFLAAFFAVTFLTGALSVGTVSMATFRTTFFFEAGFATDSAIALTASFLGARFRAVTAGDGGGVSSLVFLLIRDRLK